MNKRKLHNLLIVLLMVLQVFVSPLSAFAQDAATPVAPAATEAVQPATENAEENRRRLPKKLNQLQQLIQRQSQNNISHKRKFNQLNMS